MTKRVENAIDVFLDALNEGTLAKGSCIACAVGNLVASGLNGKILSIKDDFGQLDFKCTVDNLSWSDLFITSFDGQHIYEDSLKDKKVLHNIDATDFSWQELAQIENTFEKNCKINYHSYCVHTKEEIRKDQIKGLEAVVQLMLTFDEDKTDVKKVFTKKAELITI